MQTAAAEVDGQQQASAVKIERCRYLAEARALIVGCLSGLIHAAAGSDPAFQHTSRHASGKYGGWPLPLSCPTGSACCCWD
jgi:hypothetical protein